MPARTITPVSIGGTSHLSVLQQAVDHIMTSPQRVPIAKAKCFDRLGRRIDGVVFRRAQSGAASSKDYSLDRRTLNLDRMRSGASTERIVSRLAHRCA